MLRSLWCLPVLFALCGVCSAQEEKPAREDKASKRLDELLRPGAELGGPVKKAAAVPRATPRYLEAPDGAGVSTPLTPPTLTLPDVKAKAPSNPPEQGLAIRETTRLPADLSLPEAPLVRWPALPVNEYPPLPLMAQHQRDRASLDDATMEVSLAVILQPVFVPRSGSAPFVAINLPDPFELRKTVDLRDPPAEESSPLVTTFPRLVRR